MPTWPASAARPHDYPSGLPFVPNAATRIDQPEGDIVIMTWPAVERPFDVMQLLVGACASDGWQRQSDVPAGPRRTPPREARFRRGTALRVIEAVPAGPASFVTLTQRGAE